MVSCSPGVLLAKSCNRAVLGLAKGLPRGWFAFIRNKQSAKPYDALPLAKTKYDVDISYTRFIARGTRADDLLREVRAPPPRIQRQL
jgi:hypothetical protein